MSTASDTQKHTYTIQHFRSAKQMGNDETPNTTKTEQKHVTF